MLHGCTIEDECLIGMGAIILDGAVVESDAMIAAGSVVKPGEIVPSGKLRVKAFTRANDRLLYEYSDYTQGFGIFFREEFDRFPDLLRRYWNSIFTKDSTAQIY